MANEKYKMFKEFMFNELGITKEDIRTWVNESVKEEVRKMADQTFGSFNLRDQMHDLFTSPHSQFRSQLLSACANELIKQLTIGIKEYIGAVSPLRHFVGRTRS